MFIPCLPHNRLLKHWKLSYFKTTFNLFFIILNNYFTFFLLICNVAKTTIQFFNILLNLSLFFTKQHSIDSQHPSYYHSLLSSRVQNSTYVIHFYTGLLLSCVPSETLCLPAIIPCMSTIKPHTNSLSPKRKIECRI